MENDEKEPSFFDLNNKKISYRSSLIQSHLLQSFLTLFSPEKAPDLWRFSHTGSFKALVVGYNKTIICNDRKHQTQVFKNIGCGSNVKGILL